MRYTRLKWQNVQCVHCAFRRLNQNARTMDYLLPIFQSHFIETIWWSENSISNRNTTQKLELCNAIIGSTHSHLYYIFLQNDIASAVRRAVLRAIIRPHGCRCHIATYNTIVNVTAGASEINELWWSAYSIKLVYSHRRRKLLNQWSSTARADICL